MFSVSVAGKTQLLDHKDVPIADVDFMNCFSLLLVNIIHVGINESYMRK